MDCTPAIPREISPCAFDHFLWNAIGGCFIGVDEAGRGPLAGPVVAGAVILDPQREIAGVRDSKKIGESEREELYEKIVQAALGHAVAFVEAEVIDRTNILKAALQAMAQAVRALDSDLPVLVDGNQTIPEIDNLQQWLVKGDARSASVAAASILAKVSRDRYMREMNTMYPQYGFLRHKGYGTALHLEKIREFGPCALHRKTFKGVLP